MVKNAAESSTSRPTPDRGAAYAENFCRPRKLCTLAVNQADPMRQIVDFESAQPSGNSTGHTSLSTAPSLSTDGARYAGSGHLMRDRVRHDRTMTYRRWPSRTTPPRTAHPALEHAKLASEVSDLSRAARSRLHFRLADGLWLDRRSDADAASRAIAFQRLYPGSVLCGWSALALHGFTPPGDARPELWIGRSARRRKGLIVRRYEHLPENALVSVRTVRATSVTWTAFDLARFLPFEDAVIALEGMHTQGFDLGKLKSALELLEGTWGVRRAREALRMADTESESPMETRVRLTLDEAGITGFESQVKVKSLGLRLDLAHKLAKVAIEYDGADHFGVPQHRNDVKRINRLRAEGWEVIVVTYDILMNHREEFLAQVRTALARRGVRTAA